MKDQEILGLMEAYSSMYVPQELTEEVEIAAQYFYEMGLNEDGVDILIEELGVEEFANFVYDIAEEYVLTEARAGGVKIEPKLASGKEIKGKPKAASLKRLGAQKAARKEAEENASESKPSGMKASLQRQSAVAAAANKQPKKPGFLDRVANAVTKGIERHNAANKSLSKAASETGKTLSKVGQAASTVAKGVASGVTGTAKLAGHVVKKGLSEEVEAWVNQLVEEGYDLSEYTWDEMTEIYIAEAKIDDVKYGTGEKDSSRNSYLSKNSPNVRTDRNKRFDSTAGKLATHSEVEGKRLSKHFSGRGVKKEEVEAWVNQLVEEGYDLSEYSWDDMTEIYIAEIKGIEGHINPNTGQSSYGLDSGLAMTPRKRMETRANALQKRGEGKRANKIRAVMKRPSMDESFDIYDVILSHLLDEGYAESVDQAEVIMVNMSEEWRESIVEAQKPLPKNKMWRQMVDKPNRTGENLYSKNNLKMHSVIKAHDADPKGEAEKAKAKSKYTG
jgi:hypothetical protein